MEPGLEPDPLAWLVEEPPQKPPTVFTKKTLLSSPIILKFYPKFKVDTHKQWIGLPSKSINDEREQSLHPPEADSYFGDEMSEDDDDLLWQTESKREGGEIEMESPHAIVNVDVIVKLGSLVINGVEFAFSSALRDTVLVPGADGDTEDSLLVSLKLGFLLLIRLYHMPKNYSDSDFSKKGSSNDLLHVYKPFVVQWWKTTASAPGLIPDMDTSGASLRAHSAGLAVVSALAANVLRVYMCNQTELGMELLPHHNVPLEGNILHVCLGSSGQAAEENLIQLLTLSFSASNRLELNLFQWYVSESLTNTARRLTLPLSPSFPLPIMIIPLTQNCSFLFVCPEELIIVTTHNIILADYSFSRFEYAGTFPTSFAFPESKPGELSDEVLLASDSGTIYSIVVKDNTNLSYRPIMRIADSISVFTIQSTNEGYMVQYANDAGGAKQLLIPELLPHDVASSVDKVQYSEALLVQDYKNWAPIVDVCLIDAFETRTQVPYASQELWIISGAGKRSKLANLSVAYPLRKESRSLESVRKAERLFFFELPDSRKVIFVSLPFETRLLELEHEESSEGSAGSDIREDNLITFEKPAIFTEETALFIHMYSANDQPYFLQITSSTITFTNLEVSQTSRSKGKSILQVSSSQDFLFLLVEQDGTSLLEVVKMSSPDFDDDFDPQALLDVLYSEELKCDASCIQVIEDGSGGGTLLIGTFDERIMMLPFTAEGGFVEQDQYELDLRIIGKKDKFPRDMLVPCSFQFLKARTELMVGTLTGICLRFHVMSNALSLIQDIRLGTTPISFTLLTDNMVLACLRNLWLFDFDESAFPTKVAFDEKVSHPVNLISHIGPGESGYHKVVLVRDDGACAASVFVHRTPMVKQTTVGEPAKRLVYLENVKVFALMCKSRDPHNRLRFADRKTSKMLPSVEIDGKLGEERGTPIFDVLEFPICAFQWEVERNDRVSKKLIVGCSVNGSKGSIKIIDYSKFPLQNSLSMGVKITELYTISRDEPVTCIAQIGLTIFFASGRSIFTTSYLLSERKLRPVNTIETLTSDIASMTAETDGGQNMLIVSTKLDSVFAFEYRPGDSFVGEELRLILRDKVPKSLANHVKINDSVFVADKLHCTVEEIPFSSDIRRKEVFKTHLIPRLYKSLSQGPWAEKLEMPRMLSIGVAGDIVGFDRLEIGSPEYQAICQKLGEEGKIPAGADIDILYERLQRPFSYKLTGKAFQGIYKPYFGGHLSSKVIDYDVEELKKAASFDICL